MKTKSKGSGYPPSPSTGACRSGKLQYPNRKQARAAARKFNDSALGAYACDCGWFHIGHKPQRVRNGEVDKNAWLGIGPPPAKPAKPRPFSPADMARLAGRQQGESA